MNYTFLNATGGTQTAASSTISGVEYPVIKISDPVSIVGTVSLSGASSVSGTVGASVIGTVPVTGTVGASIIGLVPVTAAISGAISVVGQLYRNDTLASTLGADQTYGPGARDSAGRSIVKPYVAEDSATFRFSTSVVSGSVTLIQSSTIGKRSYVTDITVANSSQTFTLVTLQDGSTSIVGYLPAPATSGAIPQYTILPRTAVSQDLAFKISPAVSVVSITVNGFQAP